MKSLNKDQKNVLIQFVEKTIPENWSRIRFITKEDYIRDFIATFEKTNSHDFEDLIELYFDSLSDFFSAIYQNSDAYSLLKYEGLKRFAGLEKSWLEKSYKDYLKHNFFSEALELTAFMGFIGHEYEMFLIEIEENNLKPGFLTDWLYPARAKLIQKIPTQVVCLKNIYEAGLSPQPTLQHLKTLIDAAIAEKCYINPCIPTIIQRCEEAEIKRFLIQKVG